MGARLGGTHKGVKFYKEIDARAVRLWHYRKAMSAIKSARKEEERGNRWLTNQHDNNGAFHMRCAQALNEAAGWAGTTAEQDDLLFPAPANSRGSKKND